MRGRGTALVIAASAATLSRSLRRGGWIPSAIDGFGDLDTQHCCSACQVVPFGDDGFDAPALRSAIDRSSADIAIYGGGLDSQPDTIEYLAQRHTLIGNTAATVRLAKTPRPYFELLAKLRIPFPETRFDPPPASNGWLLKHGHSEGGAGVGTASDLAPPRPDRYFQRRLPGPPMSALFLADGAESSVIGFNTQWTAAASPSRPFRFAGAINRTALNDAQRNSVLGIIRRLVPALGLRGLNSLDFMADSRGKILALEVNPRPSATMGLYDDDFPAGLAQLHLDACRGSLPEGRTQTHPVRAFQILYSPHDAAPATTLEWPPWCRDLPGPGFRIGKGAPLCTITAEGPDEAAALRSIENRKCLVLQLIAAQPGVNPTFHLPKAPHRQRG
ncbi:MAG: ATP-grasp domain-containing protein [Methylococcus sp.]|nr:ATP-grasp domain-containing protein [Methylococcus sp.]